MTDRNFTIFAKLPAELRLKIWNTTLDGIGGRILELRCDGRRRVATTRFYNHKKPPSELMGLLGASQESRHEALRKYQIMFKYELAANALTKMDGMWFNPAIDTLFLPVELHHLCGINGSYLSYNYSSVESLELPLLDCERVQHLALDMLEWRKRHLRLQYEMAKHIAELSKKSPADTSSAHTRSQFPLFRDFKNIKGLTIVESDTRGLWDLEAFQHLQREEHTTRCRDCSDIALHERLQKVNDNAIYMSQDEMQMRIKNGPGDPYYSRLRQLREEIDTKQRSDTEAALAQCVGYDVAELPKLEYIWKIAALEDPAMRTD